MSATNEDFQTVLNLLRKVLALIKYNKINDLINWNQIFDYLIESQERTEPKVNLSNSYLLLILKKIFFRN